MDKSNRELLYFLLHQEGFGAVTIRKLYERIHPLSEILIMEEEEIEKAGGISKKQAGALVRGRENLEEILEDFARLPQKGIQFIDLEDPLFPKKLGEIYASPPGLFVRGSLPDPMLPSVAVVGSRACTAYGRGFARELGRALAESGAEVISGMANGIDSHAHRGALESASGRSFAVLACGVDICYPRENFDIYLEMGREKRGGIISENPPKKAALKQFFPMRNRIISGLCDLLIIVEAGERSGSLITAEHALEQGRDIYALPGRISDPLSRGCNRLIASGAGIITSVEEVLESLSLNRIKMHNISEKNINILAKPEKKVYSCLDLTPRYLEDIAAEAGMQTGELMSHLLSLELKGYAERVSGNYYSKKVNHNFNIEEFEYGE